MESQVAAPVVLVTGAGTGIGRATALHLVERGYTVIAGVHPALDEAQLAQYEDEARARRAAGMVPAPRLTASGAGQPRGTAAPSGLCAVALDITRAADRAAALQLVEECAAGSGLHGLVNNAAIVRPGPLELLPPEALRQQLAVNVEGTLAMTVACLPALRRARGRVLMLGSIQGELVLPLTGAYCLSKAAVNALALVLRLELAAGGVQVGLIEPGYIATSAAADAVTWWERLLPALPAEDVARYAALMAQGRAVAARVAHLGSPPAAVALVIGRALAARRMRPRYLVGRGARLQAWLAAWCPLRLRLWLVRQLFARLAGGQEPGSVMQTPETRIPCQQTQGAQESGKSAAP